MELNYSRCSCFPDPGTWNN